MKIFKKIIFLGAFIIITSGIILFIVRKPSYTIQTSGKLFIVNKLSSTISIFDLTQGKTLVEIPIDVEPHEIVKITKQNRVVITNYGAPDFEGIRSVNPTLLSFRVKKKVFNTQFTIR